MIAHDAALRVGAPVLRSRQLRASEFSTMFAAVSACVVTCSRAASIRRAVDEDKPLLVANSAAPRSALLSPAHLRTRACAEGAIGDATPPVCRELRKRAWCTRAIVLRGACQIEQNARCAPAFTCCALRSPRRPYVRLYGKASALMARQDTRRKAARSRYVPASGAAARCRPPRKRWLCRHSTARQQCRVI